MNKAKSILGALGLVALLIAGGYYFVTKEVATSSANKDKYATAYEAHALKEPFNLLSKQFDGNSWLYVYQSNMAPDLAFKQAQAQLTGGGYQIVASHHDTATTLYRDLITGDIGVKAEVNKTASGLTGINVYVTAIGKE
jgi:predicted PurR-regulated permease PerM